MGERRLAELIGAKSVELAKLKILKEATTYNVEGVPSVRHEHPEDITYIMDYRLL